jgi:hypothetical protein
LHGCPADPALSAPPKGSSKRIPARAGLPVRRALTLIVVNLMTTVEERREGQLVEVVVLVEPNP